jgi:hypothetical protein
MFADPNPSGKVRDALTLVGTPAERKLRREQRPRWKDAGGYPAVRRHFFARTRIKAQLVRKLQAALPYPHYFESGRDFKTTPFASATLLATIFHLAINLLDQ